MPRINKTRYAILGLLHYSPMSGYDIKKMTDRSISYFWQENYGHIYPVLKKMEKEGLVTSRKEEHAGNPPRIVYTLTEKGDRVFTGWMKDRTEPYIQKSELLLKLFFGRYSDKENIRKQLEEEMKHHENLVDEYETIRKHLNNDHNSPDHVPYWLLTLKNGLYFSKAQIEWCRDCLSELDNI